jgi:hypothetical protein
MKKKHGAIVDHEYLSWKGESVCKKELSQQKR